MHAHTVVLATGVERRRSMADGMEALSGKGVLYGASRAEAASVSGKELFIVGGGNSAGQAAMYFSGYANPVTLIVRGSGLSVSMSQYLIRQIAETASIAVLPNTEVVRVSGQDRLETIVFKTRGQEQLKEIQADALFIMIGADASTQWLPLALKRDEKGFVLTGRDVPATEMERDCLSAEDQCAWYLRGGGCSSRLSKAGGKWGG